MNHSSRSPIPGILLACSFLVTTAYSFEATVKWDDLRQEIKGFGATAGHGARKWSYTMQAATKKAMIDVLFDTTIGAGLSIIRGEVPYNLTGGSGAFSTTDDGQGQFMREALKRNPGIILWAAPWSPPPAWKTNGATRNGGSLIVSRYQDFADYLSTYARECKRDLGKDMYAISVQNEPHFAPPWEGCTYSPQQLHDFIRNNLGPTFVRDGVKPTIMMPESNWDQREWATPTLQDPETAKYCSVVGLHFYHDSKDATPYPEVKAAGKELWETEACWAGDGGPTMLGAELWYRKRHDVLTQAEANAWHYWWFWDSKGSDGLLISAGTSNSGDGPNNQFVETKRLWTLGNLSRFVKSGWRMMDLPSYYSSDSSLMVSAYRSETTGRFAIVAGNFDDIGRSYTVNFQFDGATASSVTPWITDETRNLVKQSDIIVTGGCFTATVPPMSVITYEGTGIAASASSPRINSLTCANERQIPGETNTLSWATSSATSVSIDNGVGTVGAMGAVTVSPTATTTYTLAAQGAGSTVLRKVTIEVLPARNPQTPPGLNPGLDYAYYETNNPTYSDFSTLTPKKTGVCAQFNVSPRDRDTDYSFKFSGYLDVPSDGVYTFNSQGCGTTMLFIDGVKVYDQDYYKTGNYARIDIHVYGSIGLKAGKHSIVLGARMGYGAADGLKLEWKGPGIARQEIPAARLFHNGLPVSATTPAFKALVVSHQLAPAMYDMRGRRMARLADADMRSSRLSGIYLEVTGRAGNHSAKTRVITR